MFRTLIRRASPAGGNGGRKISIKFPDRTAPHEGSHSPHPHPAAPQSVADDFSNFTKLYESGPHFHPDKLQPFDIAAKTPQVGIGKEGLEALKKAEANSASSSSSAAGSAGKSAAGGDVVDDIYQLPKRYWATPALQFEEQELEAVMSGGASLL